MSGPSGLFTPWIEHPIQEGRCAVCGLQPPKDMISTLWPFRAYSHYGRYCLQPSGRIVPCEPKETA